ncbi:MAG: DUF4330 domain-containing protein [Clostridia bacterium]|nr:DUF4330 domain-containing protein [Clostridia bacterium]
MNQNQTQTKKHRFNIVDFVLIIAVLACVIGIAIRYNLSTSLLRGNDTAVITVKIDGLLTEYSDALLPGDAFYYQTTGNPLGTLLTVETSPAKIRFVNTDGTVTVANYVDRVDVVCTLEVEGYASENGFMIDGTTYIGSGSDILVRSRNIETQMVVLNVEAGS